MQQMQQSQAVGTPTEPEATSQKKETLPDSIRLPLIARLRAAQTADTKRGDGRTMCLQGAIQKESTGGPLHKRLCIDFQNGKIPAEA
jgi:hypothetical protein